MTPPVTENVALSRLTTDDLPTIASWFEDPETSRSLGGPEWPAAMLAHAEAAVGTDFRGARQIGAHHYLALAGDTAVGYIDAGVFDRCTVYGGEGPDGPIILDTIDAVTGAIAFVIDPARRREGLGARMIRSLVSHPDLALVELFEAGVDPENHASRRTLEAAGFRLRSPDPDCEAMLYYELWAAAAPAA
jgi:RimJ/RimL family protein N-acetyltransferase